MALARRTAAAAAAALVLLVALGTLLFGASRREPQPVAAAPAPPAGPRFDDVLADLDAAIAAARATTERYPDSWGAREQLAGLFLQRAQLSGRYEDIGEAEAALAAIPSLTPSPAAGCATRARLHFTLHRLTQASAAIEQCRAFPGIDTASGSELAGMAAEIALYSGRYDEALAAMRRDLDAVETIPALARLSRLQAAFGHRSEALALLDRAERQYHGDSQHLRAWLQLQRAVIELDAGRWEDALAYLLAAERALPGWWLVDEHIAEIKALLGREDEARALYADVIRRTGLPEFMDALAALEQDAGNEAAAREWIARARALYRVRLDRWPEAAAGHTLDHFLRFGEDTEETLSLAQAGAAARPYAAARIQLLRAYLKVGRIDEARQLADALAASLWDTAELHAVLHHAYAAAGDDGRAAAARARALARNPRALVQFAGP